MAVFTPCYLLVFAPFLPLQALLEIAGVQGAWKIHFVGLLVSWVTVIFASGLQRLEIRKWEEELLLLVAAAKADDHSDHRWLQVIGTGAPTSAKHRLTDARTCVLSFLNSRGNSLPPPFFFSIQFFQPLDIQFPALHFPLLQIPRVGCFPGQTQADTQLPLQSETNQILPCVPPLSKNGW